MATTPPQDNIGLRLSAQEDACLARATRTNFGRLMPLLVAAYIIAFIDRTNIGMAKESLETSIGLSAAAYGLGAGLFFVCYAVLEIPSNLIMHKVGARFWIARIMLTWGLISMAMAFVWNEGSFYVLRVLLGVAEAGLYPGIILYLSYWFTQKDRAKATGLFLLGVSLANVIGAPLAGALLRLHGLLGIEGWQWMFLIEGAPAVVLCWLVWYTLPDHPRDAKWLSPEDKSLLQRVIDAEDRGRASEHHDLRSLLPVLRDPQIWLVVAIYFTHQIAVYSLSYFLPTMIKSYDASMSTMAVGLITALPWLAAAVGSTALPRYATSIGRARAFVSGGLVCVAGGLLIARVSSNLWTAVCGFAIGALMLFVIQSVLFTFPANRLSGASAASGIAFVNMCGLVGGFLGPTICGRLETSTGDKLAGLWMMIGLTVIGALLAWGLEYRKPDSGA